MNSLQAVPHYSYSRELKPLLIGKDLIEIKCSIVKIKDYKSTIETLHNFFTEKGLTNIASLKITVKHVGWFYEV